MVGNVKLLLEFYLGGINLLSNIEFNSTDELFNELKRLKPFEERFVIYKNMLLHMRAFLQFNLRSGEKFTVHLVRYGDGVQKEYIVNTNSKIVKDSILQRKDLTDEYASSELYTTRTNLNSSYLGIEDCIPENTEIESIQVTQ